MAGQFASHEAASWRFSDLRPLAVLFARAVHGHSSGYKGTSLDTQRTPLALLLAVYAAYLSQKMPPSFSTSVEKR